MSLFRCRRQSERRGWSADILQIVRKGILSEKYWAGRWHIPIAGGVANSNGYGFADNMLQDIRERRRELEAKYLGYSVSGSTAKELLCIRTMQIVLIDDDKARLQGLGESFRTFVNDQLNRFYSDNFREEKGAGDYHFNSLYIFTSIYLAPIYSTTLPYRTTCRKKRKKTASRRDTLRCFTTPQSFCIPAWSWQGALRPSIKRCPPRRLLSGNALSGEPAGCPQYQNTSPAPSLTEQYRISTLPDQEWLSNHLSLSDSVICSHYKFSPSVTSRPSSFFSIFSPHPSQS